MTNRYLKTIRKLLIAYKKKYDALGNERKKPNKKRKKKKWNIIIDGYTSFT